MGTTTASPTAAKGAPQVANLLRLLDPIGSELGRVEEALSEQVKSFHGNIDGYVDYVLGASGKRLRPSLALLAGGATDQDDDGHITLGVIVELIHVATLVHDDILDDANLRHGLPTANSRWGNEISVLLGDCLFAHALKLAASYPTTEISRKVSEATNTVCSGEILQTQRRFDLDLTLEQYLEIIKMKTGALFAVSCELGAALNGVVPAAVKAMRDFGANLGIAYQIFDDCVDIFGQERTAGKSLGTDVKKGKLTLPFLLLLRSASAESREALGAMVFSAKPQERQQLLALASRNGVVRDSLATIREYLARAEANLAVLPANPYVATMSALASYLGEQSTALSEGVGSHVMTLFDKFKTKPVGKRPAREPIVPATTPPGSEQAFDLSHEDDEVLVARARRGDGPAFDVLVERYKERLYATVYHMTSKHEDANDLVQDTFIKAYKSLGSFKGHSSFYTWVYRIAVNRTINFLKRRKNRNQFSLDDVDSSIQTDPDFVELMSHVTPRREAGLTELREKLNEALQKLSEPHRAVVAMHDIQGMTHADIARVMKCSEGTVRSRLFYARQQLQGLLGDYL